MKTNMLTRVWKNWLKKRTSERLESECEPFLSFLCVELALHPHFDRAFRSALSHTQGLLREELEKEWKAYVEKGQGLEKGLANLGSRWERRGISRVTGMLIHLSSNGVSENGIQGIQQLAKDMRHQQSISLKAYGNKLAVFSLLFIAVSALIPAFILGFLTVGSRFLELDVTSSQIYWLAVIIFPLLDVLILSWGWIQTPAWIQSTQYTITKTQPVSIRSIREKWSAKMREMEAICVKNGIRNGFSSIIFSSVLEGAALFLIVWSAYLHVQSDSPIWILFLVGAGGCPLIINWVWQHSAFAHSTKLMEHQIPDALLGIAATPSTKGFVATLESVIPSLENPLKAEWKRMVQRMKRGMPIDRALEKWGEGRESRVFMRVRQVLVHAYRSGHSLIHPCVQLAYELFETHSLHDERNATLLIEKYTILAAGGVLVPFLLGILTGVVTNLPFSSFTETDPGIFSAVQGAVPLYLLIYSILAACFVAFQEGQSSKMGMYVLILVPLAQIAFLIGKVWVGA